ncbi:MAG: hypothetical protein LUH22_11675 [Bacteroides sp.]|nr:hypothetical protein [Bacteroides sp.]
MVLDFIGRVNIAINIVKEKYPSALLYEADGSASKGETTRAEDIDTIRIVFVRPEDGATIIIKSNGYSRFDEPIVIPEPWLEDVVIEWPIEMTLLQANKLKEEAGYKNPYVCVTLRNPLGPVSTNPYFIFGDNHHQPFIFVDTVTGDVKTGR